MKIFNDVIELSHRYGTQDFVKGGGGNISVKDGGRLWIKPSGTTLAGLKESDLLELDRVRIKAVYEIDPDLPDKVREARVTASLSAAKVDGNTARRPSVEAPLHDLIEKRFVVHTHPGLVGGLVCGCDSREECARMFPDALYVEATDPGYRLAVKVRGAVREYRASRGKEPVLIFFENHGVVVGGDSPEEVDAETDGMMNILREHYEKLRIPMHVEVDKVPADFDADRIVELVARVAGVQNLESVVSGGFDVARGPLTPDHIVYMKSYAFTGVVDEKSIKNYIEKYGYMPRVIVDGGAVVAVGATQSAADLAMELALDGALVEQLTAGFGGVRYMSDAARLFIENWEAESYRQKQAGA